MKTMPGRFRALLCVKKDFIESARQAIVKRSDVHFQITSSPRFMMSRAIFSPPNMVLMDASFDKVQLMDTLATFRLQFTDVPLYLLASSARHRDPVDTGSFGVKGCFVLPGDSGRMDEEITTLIRNWQLTEEQQRFIKLQHRAYNFDQIIGTSKQIRFLLERAKKLIDNPLLTVLITGETGTGKELLARAIHYNGKNHASPFVDIGCSALPENLLESELFGYEKGAFTDAREKKLGLLELAGEGTILLDEIGDISMAMQSKLLKVLESRTMRRLGGLKDIPVRGRIIAATSVDITARMKAGQFRKDLYHRLKIVPLEVPPLRDRREDIPLLVESFIKTFNPLYGRKIRGISPEALSILAAQTWEGNIRELKHTIERAILLEEGDILTGKDFGFLNPAHREESADSEPENRVSQVQAGSADTFLLSIPFDEAGLDDVQRRLALQVLDRVGGNKTKAAYILRISRPRLDRILKAVEVS
jgi:DNA-binding NtrC family response regulator